MFKLPLLIIILILSLSVIRCSFYPKTEDATTCSSLCYFQSGCLPGTECMNLLSNQEWHTANGAYTECQEMATSWSLPDSDYQTKFDKEKACKQKIAQEESNPEMKKVQTCQSGCLDQVLQNKSNASCLSNSSCFANQKRCIDQCTSDNSCDHYSCYGGKEVYDEEILQENEHCSALKEKNDGYLNIYQPMEPYHLHLYFKCIEYLDSRPSISQEVINTQTCQKQCSDTIKPIIQYDPSNPSHTQQNTGNQEKKQEKINDLYPTTASLGLCFNSCHLKTNCDDTCQTNMQSESFSQMYAGIPECLSFGMKSQSISQENWQEVFGLYKTCLSKMAQNIDDSKVKATQTCYSSCVTDISTWFTEQTCISEGTCFYQHDNCMDTCEQTNNCPDSNCFGEQDFGQAIEVDSECKKVQEQTKALENPYSAVDVTLMDAYNGCLDHIRTKYSKASTDPTINCWDECINNSNNLIQNSSLALTISGLFVVVFIIVI